MNITDLIVELLKEGRRVELPGMGTFDSEVQSPRHDPQTQIYYPATRNILFKKECTGDNSIVSEIAARECVNEDIAGQMWHNYMDALTDKLSRSSEHSFGELGVLSKEGDGFRFKMADGLVIEAGNSSEKPLEGVKTYTHDENEDPFAQFEETAGGKMENPEPAPAPIPEPMPEPEPEPVPEPEPEPMPEPEPEPMPEPEPEPEPLPEPEPETKPIEPEVVAIPIQELGDVAAAESTELQDTLKKLDNLPKSKSVLKAEAKAEKERAKKQAEEEKAQAKAKAKEEKQALKEKKKQEKLQQKQESKAKSDNLVATEEPRTEEEEKKKGHKWLLWLLLLLLLLVLAGGGYYYYTHYMQNDADGKNTEASLGGKHLDVSAENDLTFNCDDLVFTNGQMAENSDKVCAAMDEFINTFLAGLNYQNAKAPMMARVRDYANMRMNELMGKRFAVQPLIPYNDYIKDHSKQWLEYDYAKKVRNIVQGELMDFNLLEEMLGKLNLEPNDKQLKASDVQKVKQQEREAVKKKNDKDNTVPSAYITKDSKQGFDIIAGFYLDKSTANKMAVRLKSQGCDAYILEKNDGFYVSMGSAPTRTKADALFKHLKSWYDGDIAIKQW